MIELNSKGESCRTVDDWRTMVARYFDAETSDAEETELRRFAVSPMASGHEFDELRAVMGLVVVGRRLTQQRKAARRRRRVLGYAAAAVVFIVVGMAGWMSYSRSNYCVAYIGGVRYTDKEVVLAEMHRSMSTVGGDAAQESVEAALSDMFDTIDDSKE